MERYGQQNDSLADGYCRRPWPASAARSPAESHEQRGVGGVSRRVPPPAVARGRQPGGLAADEHGRGGGSGQGRWRRASSSFLARKVASRYGRSAPAAAALAVSSATSAAASSALIRTLIFAGEGAGRLSSPLRALSRPSADMTGPGNVVCGAGVRAWRTGFWNDPVFQDLGTGKTTECSILTRICTLF